MTKLQVVILGQTFTLRSDAPAEEVQRIAAFVNERIGEVAAQGRSADSLNVALLALLNVSGAYLRQAGQEQDEQHEACARLERLLHRVEQACVGAALS